MTTRRFTLVLILAIVSPLGAAAHAAISRSSAQGEGTTYEECSVQCREFADARACWEFRKGNLICTEKKKSTWPIFTATMQGETGY